MQQIQIDVIGAESPQTAFAGLWNALAAGVVRVDLAHQKDAGALPGDGFSHHFFSPAFGVHLCRVDQGHAHLDAQAQRSDFLRLP
ncbi:hypothetical protein D3C72_1753670 [compost metagenome]